MNVEKNNQEPQPHLCKSCNKFYGSTARQGLCSKCYGPPPKVDHLLQINHANESSKVESTKSNEPSLPKGPQENKSKCFTCRRKVGLLGIECKCGYVYCNQHRLPQEHQCGINYEEKGKEKLKKQNVKIEHSKLAQL